MRPTARADALLMWAGVVAVLAALLIVSIRPGAPVVVDCRRPDVVCIHAR